MANAGSKPKKLLLPMFRILSSSPLTVSALLMIDRFPFQKCLVKYIGIGDVSFLEREINIWKPLPSVGKGVCALVH